MASVWKYYMYVVYLLDLFIIDRSVHVHVDHQSCILQDKRETDDALQPGADQTTSTL